MELQREEQQNDANQKNIYNLDGQMGDDEEYVLTRPGGAKGK